MSRLLDLPVEILQQIIAATLPNVYGVDGFEQFMLTCRRVYHCGHDYIAQHNYRTRLFRMVRVGGSPGEDSHLNQDLAEYLLGIAMHPEIACYVQTLSIDEHGMYNDFGPVAPGLTWLRNSAPGSPDDMARAATDVVMGSPWLDAAGCDKQAWLNDIPHLQAIVTHSQVLVDHEAEQFAASATLVLLLTMLPRLELLHIGKNIQFASAAPRFNRDITRVLELMSARIGNDGTEPCKHESMPERDKRRLRRSWGLRSPLENLHEVHFCPVPDYETSFCAQPLNPLLSSPHVRTFFGSRITAYNSEPLVRHPVSYFWPGTESPDTSWSRLLSSRTWSGIQRLELDMAFMDPQGVGNLLSHMPHLTVFRYSHDADWGGLGLDWDAGAFVNAIAAASPACLSPNCTDPPDSTMRGTLGTRLTDLAISIEEELEGKIVTGFWSLREFTALKRLAVDPIIFMGPHPDSGERRISAIPDRQHAHPPTDPSRSEPWDPLKEDHHIPKLIDILPDGLEELDLFLKDGITPSSLSALLRGFQAGLRQRRLPHLRKFRFQDYYLPGGRSSARALVPPRSEQRHEQRRGLGAAATKAGAESFQTRFPGMFWQEAFLEAIDMTTRDGYYHRETSWHSGA